MKTYTMYKEDDKWILESKNGDKAEHSEHGKRINGVKSLFALHPGLPWFTIAYPQDKDTQVVMPFRKDGHVWRFGERKYPSQLGAVRGFFALHPRMDLFYISIPNKEETNG